MTMIYDQIQLKICDKTFSRI